MDFYVEIGMKNTRKGVVCIKGNCIKNRFLFKSNTRGNLNLMRKKTHCE